MALADVVTSAFSTKRGNVLKLMSGTALAQAVLVISAPLLTRLYGPGDYGVAGIYISIAAVATVVAAWRYELAIPLTRGDADAANLLCLSLGLCVGMGLATGAVVFVLRDQIASVAGMPGFAAWVWLIPGSVTLAGSLRVLGFWSSRRGEFGRVAVSRVAQSVTAIGAQLLGPLRASGFVGLITGQIAGQLAGAGLLAIRIGRADGRLILTNARSLKMIALARRYRLLALSTVPTALLNSASGNLLPIAVSAKFGPAVVGLFLFAQQLLLLPASILTSSVWDVTHAEIGKLPPAQRSAVLARVHQSVCAICAFPVAAVALFGHFSGAVLGSHWSDLERILPAIAVMVFLNAVSNATSYFAAFGYYAAESIANASLLAIRVAALMVGAQTGSAFAAINMYAGASAVAYLGINVFWGVKLGRLGEFLRNLLTNLLIAAAILLPVRALVSDLWVTVLLGTLSGVAYYGRLLWLERRRSPSQPAA